MPMQRSGLRQEKAEPACDIITTEDYCPDLSCEMGHVDARHGIVSQEPDACPGWRVV